MPRPIIKLRIQHSIQQKRNNTILQKIIKYKNQFHAVSRTQQGRQREPSVKTLRSPLSVEFRGHCVFSGGTQRRAMPLHQSEEIKI